MTIKEIILNWLIRENVLDEYYEADYVDTESVQYFPTGIYTYKGELVTRNNIMEIYHDIVVENYQNV